jgi:hypothetical protein
MFKKINDTDPITYWWYTPSIYGLKSIYIPTFAHPLSPYIHINPYFGPSGYYHVPSYTIYKN